MNPPPVASRSSGGTNFGDIASGHRKTDSSKGLGLASPPQAVEAGANVQFSVGVSGTQPISYQWQWNGMPIPGANGPSLTVAADYPAGGIYSVVIANSGGTVSSGADLVVRPVFGEPQFMPGTGFWLPYFGTPGRSYQVEYTTNLAGWLPLGLVTNTVVEGEFLDGSAPGIPQRIYRLRVAP